MKIYTLPMSRGCHVITRKDCIYLFPIWKSFPYQLVISHDILEKNNNQTNKQKPPQQNIPEAHLLLFKWHKTGIRGNTGLYGS